MRNPTRVLWSLGATLVASSLASCGGKPDSAAGARPATRTAQDARHEQMVDEIATTLQACSYEGQSLVVEPAEFGKEAPADCRAMVDRVMDYTGLPKNFVVAAGPVPNAMAAIMLDPQKVPRRVIAFNPDFIKQVKAATGGGDWAPVSIMAHEIGHHLSGHTITEGHSRPEIELEADKFSGYVLYKMGAPLADSTRAILAIGSPTDQPTHPGRDRRAAAITQGWQEACAQTGSNCAAGAGTTTTTPTPSTAKLTLPLPTAKAIPLKYGRFVVDEFGVLDPARVQAMEKKLFALAQDPGIEVTFLLVKDLHGMTPEDYAWTMMRQLRVGKLDVGNGAVVVVAPTLKQAGVAFGPGMAKEAEFSNPKRQLLEWIDSAWGYCTDEDGCKTWTDSLFGIFDGTLFHASKTHWDIRFQSVGEVLAFGKASYEDRMRTKREFDDARDQPLDRLIRFTGTVESLTAPVGIGQTPQSILDEGHQAISVKSEDGYPAIVYLHPRTRALMAGGSPEVGKRYTFVGRLQATGDERKQQSTRLWLFSYDPL